MIKKLLLVALSIILIFSITACNKNEETTNPTDESPMEVVAKVNDKEISWEQYRSMVGNMKSYYQQFGMDFEKAENKELLDMLEAEAINVLIQEELIYQSAVEKNYKVTDEDIDKELEGFKAQYEKEEEFLSDLEANSLTLDSLREKIAKEKLLSMYMQNEISEPDITEEEIKALYDEHSKTKEDLPSLEEIRAELTEEVKQKKVLAGFEDLIEVLKSKSKVEIFL